MRINQRLRNGQAKPEPSKATGNLGLSLFECVKDFIDCFFFDANAGVDDASLNLIWRRVKQKELIASRTAG